MTPSRVPGEFGTFEAADRGHALLVVDVQLDFLPEGSLAVPEGDAVIPILNRWLAAAQQGGIPVFASRDWHPPDHGSFRQQGGPWPPHCVQGTPGAAFDPDLQLPASAVIISKGMEHERDSYSAFDGTGLARTLRSRGIHTIWCGGLALDYCVRASALDARDEGFAVHLILPATRPIAEDTGRRARDELVAAGVRIDWEAAERIEP